MIQRPQSICLLIAIVFLLITTITPAIWSKSEDTSKPYFEVEKHYQITPWAFEDLSYGDVVGGKRYPYNLVGSFILLAAILAIYELLSYKRRTRQLKIGLLNTLLIAVSIGLMLYLTTQKDHHLLPHISGKYLPAFWFPFIALFSNWLASHLIRKDEKLVQDSERMR